MPLHLTLLLARERSPWECQCAASIEAALRFGHYGVQTFLASRNGGALAVSR